MNRIYRTFTHKEAVFRISCDADCFDAVTLEIIRQRKILENYICRHPEFARSLEPVKLQPDAPQVALRMAQAAQGVGVGPMAAVAGAMAQLAVEAGLAAGAHEVIVDNGGDIYLQTAESVAIGLYAGKSQKINQLAFVLQPQDTPVSICSSSGRMGHSMSLGQCDLATIVAKDAALADAAATLAANIVKEVTDVEPALNRVTSIEGVEGVLIVKEGRIGLAGKLPPLTRTS
ncbi:MAG: UPF0280 family protein [Planctomycetales bacterium]|nr:UPF0280 family protein [Planctomycetales bacterium]